MNLTKLWDVGTNLSFIAAGITTVVLLGDSGAVSWLFMFSMLLLTIGSGIFHAEIFKYPIGNHLDVGAMYFTSLVLLTVAVSTYTKQVNMGDTLVMAVLFIAPLFIWFFRFYLKNIKMEYKIAAIFVTILLTAEFRQAVLGSSVEWIYLLIALQLMIFAVIFRLVLNDKKYPWSHGVWHLVSAAGLAYFYAGLRLIPISV